MTGEDLFGGASPTPGADAAPARAGGRPAPTQPLADRLRPACLADVVGQGHLLGPEGTLALMLERGTLPSLILWGG
ncbi:MAG: replication-associated recombination protein A, partial [Acetobacter fabarum]